jgi:hypothetical protein
MSGTKFKTGTSQIQIKRVPLEQNRSVRIYYQVNFVHNKCQDSAVGIAAGYGLNGRGIGVRVPVGSRFVPFPRRPDWLWGSLSLQYNRYRMLFPRA